MVTYNRDDFILATRDAHLGYVGNHADSIRLAGPLRMRLEGTVSQDGTARPLTIEKRELDYRPIPGSDLYESYRQVLSIGGWQELGPEAAEAQRQMAELEQQLLKSTPKRLIAFELACAGHNDIIRHWQCG